MTVTAIITRPIEEAQETARLMNKRGYNTLIDPLLAVTLRLNAAAEIEAAFNYHIQTIVVTSSNAIKALARITERRNLPILAVGAATAAAAKSFGFYPVSVGGGNGILLTEMILEHHAPEDGDILYLCGEVVSCDIEAILISHGFSVRKVITYYTHEAEELSEETRRLISSDDPAIVLFYSARTAQTWTKLITHHGLEQHLTTRQAYTLSPQITHAVSQLPWQSITHAEHPTQEALLALT